MGAARAARAAAPHGRLWHRGAARRRGEHDPRSLPLNAQTVTLVVARDCHLCERAREELAELRDELGFGVVEVDISGVPELEHRYREWIPVVEVAGERVSVYRVEPDLLRRKLWAEA